MSKKGKRVLYYFSKDPTNALPAVPSGFEVVENPKSGLPMLKKKEVSGVFGSLFGGKEKEAKTEK